jgi:hypothetical protein
MISRPWATVLQVCFVWAYHYTTNILPEDLASKKRYSEAGRVLLDYAKDVREAVIALVQGNRFSEARRIVSRHFKAGHSLILYQVTLTDSQPFLTEIIHPGALESRAQISEDIGEMREQLRKQLQRIRELRVKKAEEPGEALAMNLGTCLTRSQTPSMGWKTTPTSTMSML